MGKEPNKEPNKETTVKAAEAKASAANKADLEKLVLEECMLLTAGKTHSVQQIMAYCRRLKKK